MSYKALDSFCIALILCSFIYELPLTAIVRLTTAFGYFDGEIFYSYRVKFAAFVIAVVGLNFLVNHRYILKNTFSRLYAFFWCYMAVIVWLNRDIFGYESYVDTEEISALTFYLPILFKYILFFMLGVFLPRLHKYRKTLFIVVLFLLCMIVVHVDFESMTLNKQRYVDQSSAGIYLFIGDATSIAALVTIAFIQTNKNKIIFAILCGITIFLVGSRTSFAVFTGTIFLYFLVSFKTKLLFISAIVLVVAGIWLSTLDFSELESRNPRMFGVLVDYQGDDSVMGRREFADYGWEDISDNLIMGNFGGQLEAGPAGIKKSWRFYMHDVFSYWRQFGILAFLIIVIFAIQFYSTLWKFRDRRKQSIFALHFLIGVFICVETIFSRSFTFQYSHIFFGLTVALSYTLFKGKKYSAVAAQYNQLRNDADIFVPPSSDKRRKRRSSKKSMRF